MSNELKCTGGNWEIDPVLPTVVRLSPYARLEQTLEVDNCSPTDYNSFTRDGGEAEANANLIAASKDLYNALKDLLYWYKEVSSGRITENYQVAEQAETALQKANTNYKP